MVKCFISASDTISIVGFNKYTRSILKWNCERICLNFFLIIQNESQLFTGGTESMTTPKYWTRKDSSSLARTSGFNLIDYMTDICATITFSVSWLLWNSTYLIINLYNSISSNLFRDFLFLDDNGKKLHVNWNFEVHVNKLDQNISVENAHTGTLSN